MYKNENWKDSEWSWIPKVLKKIYTWKQKVYIKGNLMVNNLNRCKKWLMLTTAKSGNKISSDTWFIPPSFSNSGNCERTKITTRLEYNKLYNIFELTSLMLNKKNHDNLSSMNVVFCLVFLCQSGPLKFGIYLISLGFFGKISIWSWKYQSKSF